jgi:rfaE bifunctional protein kinase chain/domain
MQLETVAAEIQRKTKGRKKVVFVSGNFNVVHPGHLRLLKFAADCGNYLVVGVYPDGTSDTVVPEALRLDSIKSIGFVDQAFILREPLEECIAQLKPAVVVKGKEYEDRHNRESSIVESYGGKVLFGSGDITFSSMDLLQREFRETEHTTVQRPKDYIDRHKINVSDLYRILSSFSQLKVTVIGDLIVDEYITCDPIGMSQEDPTIVVTPIRSDKFIGGAGIVAAHARGLGADVQFFSVVGPDNAADFAREKLSEYGVEANLFIDESRPTSLKQRFRAAGKTLLRVSQLRQHEVSRGLATRMNEALQERLAETDLLIFSDFNYGCLPDSLVQDIVLSAQKHDVMMVADSQSSSQIGDVSRFKGMSLLTPTEREARLAVRDFSSGLVVLAEQLAAQASSKNVALTLGSEGVLILGQSANSANGQLKLGIDSRVGDAALLTDRLPALNLSPKDTSGAGDSLLTCSSMAMAVGASIWEAMYLGSIAAACQVSRVGNIPLHTREIEAELGH